MIDILIVSGLLLTGSLLTLSSDIKLVYIISTTYPKIWFIYTLALLLWVVSYTVIGTLPLLGLACICCLLAMRSSYKKTEVQETKSFIVLVTGLWYLLLVVSLVFP